ncbi:MAG: hypothetical protein ACOCWG_02140 [bacterium]
MKTRILDILKKLKENIQAGVNPKLVIFLFFLFLSTILWFLNSLNQGYITGIDLPIKYVNLPKDKVIRNYLPNQLQLKVESQGYNLLRYKYFLKPVVIDVSSLTAKKISGDTMEFNVLTSSISDELAGKLGELTIRDISPDTLFFRFDKAVVKKVPVIPNITVEYEAQFNLRGKILIQPDSILVSGAETVIDTLNQVSTIGAVFTSVNKVIEKELPLEKIKNVNFSTGKVKIIIPVDRFTESNIKIPIEVINLPDSLNLRIFPKEVKVSFLVALNDYEKIATQLFEAVVDYKEISGETIRVQLVKYPEYIVSPNIHPKYVEYILEKK